MIIQMENLTAFHHVNLPKIQYIEWSSEALRHKEVYETNVVDRIRISS